MKMIRIYLAILCCASLLGSGCKEKSTTEKMKDSFRDVGDDIKDGTKKAYEETKEAVKDAAEEVKDAVK